MHNRVLQRQSDRIELERATEPVPIILTLNGLRQAEWLAGLGLVKLIDRPSCWTRAWMQRTRLGDKALDIWYVCADAWEAAAVAHKLLEMEDGSL